MQYTQSLKMSLWHPLFGVGPGNWPVVYPKHAVRNDPSMSDSDAGTTSNPWPSSDWIASVSERSIIATACLALALLGITLSAFRQLRRATTAEEGLLVAALLGTLAGAAVTGLFDAVLLLAAPTFLIWAALGVLWKPEPLRPAPRLFVVCVMLLVAFGVYRSAVQLAAMQISGTHGDRASLVRAANLDPGSYRTQLRLARMGNRSQRCPHARAAHALYPQAQAGIEVSRGCGR